MAISARTSMVLRRLTAGFVVLTLGFPHLLYGQPLQREEVPLASITRLSLDTLTVPRYGRSFQTTDGTVYIQNHVKAFMQADGRIKVMYEPQIPFPEDAIKEGALNTFLLKPGLFVALGYRIAQDEAGRFSAPVWKATDASRGVDRAEARVILPDAGKVYYGVNGEWAGLFCHRGIIQLHDGTLLAAVYGNFEQDTLTPTNKQSRLETRYMLRAFVMASTDGGDTWVCRASLAVPRYGQKDDSEGYNEWTMVELQDGRILAVIRTGHFTPPVLCFSSDKGHTWSAPSMEPELGPALCDPYLLKLSDGRIALSFGQMEQPEGDRTAFFDQFSAGDHPRKCRLAISDAPATEHWRVIDITGFGDRSAYTTIFEMKPGILLYQAGPEVFQIGLAPADAPKDF